MTASAELPINASREKIWAAVTDIENSADLVSAINEIEILEKPESGLVGLKWRETRTMFGKEATEVMWVTHAEAPKYYRTRAESHGAVYISEVRIREEGGQQILEMGMSAEPQSLMAKIFSPIMGLFMKGSIEKAFLEDIKDIKAKLEG